MWKLVFFIPLLALTIYIMVQSIRSGKNDKLQKKRMINLALKMLRKNPEKEEPDYKFYEFDFSDEDNPYAIFDLIFPKEVIPFEVKDGKIIRRTSRKH